MAAAAMARDIKLLLVQWAPFAWPLRSLSVFVDFDFIAIPGNFGDILHQSPGPVKKA
jgi:hypothetical protein